MIRRVLIVEDEALIALDLKSRLECAGYSVVGVADSMEEALALVEKKSPDIVLMDIRIRGEHDGIETAARIRRCYDIPVIFVTAYADRETLERAKLTEPFGYIMKPVVNVDFQAQVETVLWKHAMERQLRNSEAWLAATLRNVGNAMIAANAEGNVVFMNPHAEELTGWTSEAARDQPLMEVLSVFDEQTGRPMINPLEAIYDGRELIREPGVYQLVSRNGLRTALVEAAISANRADG
ncbi:MAG: response regulator, partial [Acidobacteria bacterium]|nr:response regulator [Acidobacteriota bacterium]